MTTPEIFADLPAPIRTALRRRGFTELTPVQRAVVDALSDGRDLRISSQTGSGKTIAIGLALADHFLSPTSAFVSASASASASPQAAASKEVGGGKTSPHSSPSPSSQAPHSRPKGPRGGPKSSGAARPTALVIVPTRELAMQVREELDWLYKELRSLKVEVVTGGTSIMMERRALSRGPGLIVGTPGRLLDHLRNKAIECDAIEHVVLDEADQMLDMGFKEELDAILETLPPARRSHLVSATFPRAVQSLANRFQSNPLTIEGTQLGVANADIQHIGYAIRKHETYAALVNVLLMAGDERALLFVNRRVDATDLAEKLAKDGFGAAPFSGELPQAQRTRTLSAFRNGTLPILVSTEVAARGIDVPGISTVIHIDPPRTPDAYTHRSGRTGRAGQAGRSILFATPSDMGRVKRTLKYARVEMSWQPIPTPEKVAKALRKKARRELHAQLAEHTPEESQWMYAKQLLEDRDPVQVVAVLLDLAAPEVKRTPMKVIGFDPTTEPAPRGRGDRAGGAGRGPRGRENASRDSADYTRFFVSWGEESGATTGRLLSQVCRRGGIESNQVGAIEVAARVSFVSVSNSVAKAFEQAAGKPDSRDPGIVIKRAEERTPRPSSGRPRREGGRPAHSSSSSASRSNSASTGNSQGRAPGQPPSGPAAQNREGSDSRGPHKGRGGQEPRGRRPKPGGKRPGGFKSKRPGYKPAR